VVGRRAPELDGEPYARPVAKLVRVKSQPESGRPARFEHRPTLVGVERALLAERVDPPRRRGTCGQHLAAHQCDVVVDPPVVLLWHDVRPEERGVLGQLTGDPEETCLVLRCEAVARLDLDGRRARSPCFGTPEGSERSQLGLGRRPCR